MATFSDGRILQTTKYFIPRNRYIFVLTRCLHRKLSPYGADMNFTNMTTCLVLCLFFRVADHQTISPIVDKASEIDNIYIILSYLPFLGMILHVHVFAFLKVILYPVKDRYPSLYWLPPCVLPPTEWITITHCIWFP